MKSNSPMARKRFSGPYNSRLSTARTHRFGVKPVEQSWWVTQHLLTNMERRLVHICAGVTKTQAERLQERVSGLPFKVQYQEEQHGPLLVARIGCSNSQLKLVQEILHELAISIDGE